VHWLPDPGTGSYVTRDLFWFRSTLAHNAPRLDGADQPMADAECEAFDVRQQWSWVKGTFKEVARVLVMGPAYMVGVLEFNSPEERLVELPLHLQGSVEVLTPGTWKTVDGEAPFLESIEQFHPSVAGMVELRATQGERRLTVHLHGHDELLRASCPGLPGSESRGTVFMQRRKAKYARFTTLLVPGGEAATGFSTDGTEVKVATASGAATHRAVPEGWDVEVGGRVVAQLRGRRKKVPGALLRLALGMAPSTAQGVAARIAAAPALDGTLAGFDLSHPIVLDHDDQYRRSEQPYGGPEEFAAEAWVNWNADGLYLAVSVRKADLSMRAPGAQPLGLDNEPDAIHADGLQIYLDAGEGPVGLLVAPDPRSNAVSVYPEVNARGVWSPTDDGYVVTLGLAPRGWEDARLKESIRFDLLVNEMRPDRERRSGQLVWSGGGGWVYLRGDRQDPSRFGVLTLA
jgi:hypothetical protein